MTNIPNGGSPLQIFFNLVLWSLLTYFTYKHRFYPTLPYRKLIWCGMLVFVLFPYWCSDYFHYMSLYFEPGIYDHFEGVYAFLRDFTMPSYLMFRFLVWGTALIEMYFIIKRIQLSEPYAVFSIMIIFFLWFSYGRVSLAIATSMLGLTFLTHPIRQKKVSHLVFLFLVVVSIFFHRSALLIVVLSLAVGYVPINKSTFLLCVSSIPIIVYLLNNYFMAIMLEGVNISEEDQLLLTYYVNDSISGGRNFGTGPQLMWFFQRFSIYSMAVYLIREQFFKNRKLQKGEYTYFKLAILFLIIAFAFDSSNALVKMTTRIRIMSVFPLAISFAAHVEKFGENKWTRRIIKIVLMNPIYTLVYLMYCSTVG